MLEVVHSLAVSVIPNSPGWLLGLSIFRGEPVAMVQPHAVIKGAAKHETTRNFKTIIFRSRDDEAQLALPVDRINEMITFPAPGEAELAGGIGQKRCAGLICRSLRVYRGVRRRRPLGEIERMERRSEGSRLHTMRGKIFTLIVVLAVANAVVGSAIFVFGSMLLTAAWIPAAITLIVVTGTTIAFAYWIANRALLPLDKLNLLAKSIERNPGMSVPATTGAVETDDLLHTVSRASRQLSNFIDLMDDVVAGNTQAALQPFEQSDRFSESFQKLVAKVTDSIGAKAKLDLLQSAVDQISSEVEGLDRGETVRIRTDLDGTRQITDALKLLLEQRAEVTQTVASSSTDLKTLVSEGKNRVSAALEKEAALARSIKKAVNAVSETNSGSQGSSREHAAVLEPLSALLRELKSDPSTQEEKVKSQAAIRRQFDTAINKLRDVGEQSLAITHVAKAVQDLAKRSNMIALNTSIQANGEDLAGLDTLTQEITSLSERAEKANKAIAGISDSVVRDVNEANASMQWASTEVGKIIARTEKTEETIVRMIDALNVIEGVKENIELEIAESANKEVTRTSDYLKIALTARLRSRMNCGCANQAFKCCRNPWRRSAN